MKDILWLMILYLLLSWSSQHLHLPHLLHINKEKCLERGKKFLIFPGTKWCGYGDKAKDYNDLGRFAVTDRCCRDHDHCPDRIHSHETKYNLHNGGQFTRMLCKCDGVFYTCLKTAHSKVSKEVGTAYFNLMTNKCFSFEHPISRCRRFHRFVKQRCVEYDLNMTAPGRWQWFDLPLF